ncbi:NAD(P)H-dependent oxidoreductase [Catenulispora subtropica]|uniref:NAD(P)H-dependent oxidoreductase n=1 Tax=Catenulispora subtropica TaxID=450798 RepID=A0ABP5CAD7_9ACTN
MPRLLIITSTTRPGRAGTDIAAWARDLAHAHGAFDVEVADLAEIDLPFLDEPEHAGSGVYAHDHTRAWSAIVDRADAFLILTAEYNRGITAPLKNAMDYLYREWNDKPVGFLAYGMSSSGLRAAEMASQIAVALAMVPVGVVPLSLRQLRDTGLAPHHEDSLRELLDGLARYSGVLAALRADSQPLEQVA